MASLRVSAGVYANVTDFSQYAPQLGKSALCLLGGASKGPLNTPIFVTNEADLVDNFGPPLLDDYGLQAAVQYLKRGDRLTYVRVARNALAADTTVPGLEAATPAVAAAGTVSFTGSTNPADGDTVTLRSRIPTANLNADNVGAAANVTITKTGANITVTGMSGGTVSARATGTVTIPSAQPADGNTVVINDGVNPAVTFEFDSNASVTPSATLRQVVIGADIYATMENLITAINAAPTLAIAAVAGHVSKTFEFDSNNAVVSGNTGVLIGATAAASLLNLISAINAQTTVAISAANATVTVPALALTQGLKGIAGNSLVSKVGTNIGVTGMTGGTDAVPGNVTTVMGLIALNPGEWGNEIVVTVQATTTLGAPSGNFDLIVKAPVDQSGTLGIVERFLNMSLDSDSDRYLPDVLENGIAGESVNTKSRFITADVLEDSGEPSAGTYTLGTAGGTVGTNGVSGLLPADYIGSVNGQTATGLKAVRNPEKTTFNILAIPGNSHKDVIDAIFEVCEFRNDCEAIIDPPFGASLNQVIDWHNGLSNVFANSPSVALNTRAGVLYWPWAKADDSYSGKKLWLPPSGFAAAVWAYNDNVAGPQFAPAGPNRGKVDALDIEYSPDQEERDLLTGDQNRVNPFVNFNEGGIEIYGNRTLQRTRTALDNIHVQRMLIYVMKLVCSTVRFLVFEPNDPTTWLKFNGLVNPILENMKQDRGIARFFVLCDASTNPAQQRQNKTMRGIIKIEAVEAAEIISVDFALYKTGEADFNLPATGV